MLLHLEKYCKSGTKGSDLNLSAATVFQWKKFIKKDFRSQLLSRSFYQGEPFECPTCKDSFPTLSGLFQHVWSPACSQSRNGGAIGKLKRWLWKNHAHG